MYEELRPLCPRDCPRRIDGRLLSRMHRRGSLRSRTAHRPPVLVADDVLITFCHGIHLCFKVYKIHNHDNM